MNFEATITDTRLAAHIPGELPRITIRRYDEAEIDIDGGEHYGRLVLDREMAVLLGRLLCAAVG